MMGQFKMAAAYYWAVIVLNYYTCLCPSQNTHF